MTTQSAYQLVYKNSLYPGKFALSPQGHITDSGKTTRRVMADPNEIPSISGTAHFSLKWTWLTHRRCSPTPNSQASSGNRNVACILERKANESPASNCWKQPGTRESRAAQPRHTQPRLPSRRKAVGRRIHPINAKRPRRAFLVTRAPWGPHSARGKDGLENGRGRRGLYTCPEGLGRLVAPG